MAKCLSIVLALVCAASPCVAAEGPTWVQIDAAVYGAKPDERGPIGGGKGYANVTTKGDYTAKSLDALLDALAKAKAGQVVFIPAETEIDLTARIYIEGIASITTSSTTASTTGWATGYVTTRRPR